MDILLILFLFFLAWLAGHALDRIFTFAEKIVQSKSQEQPVFGNQTKAAHNFNFEDKRSVRLYVVPSATAKH